jgi:hypothetical protein
MQHISLAALLIFLLPALSFSQQTKHASVCTQPEKTDAADEIVLTVCNYEHGMAPLMQPRLFFRLHKSGRIEYEVDDAGNSPEVGFENWKLKIKEARITANDVDEIIRLGQMEDFQNAAPNYPAYQIWNDSRMESTLVFKYGGREKRIVVNNFSLVGDQKRVTYPTSLFKTLTKVWQLRPPDYEPTVRDILLDQPDFMATETYTSSFMGHGFSTTFKTAKRDECYRRQSATMIMFACWNQPTTSFDIKAREYSVDRRAQGRAADSPFLSDVQTFAKLHTDAGYRLAGTAMIGEQECQKIEVKLKYNASSFGNGEFTYVFHVAKNLKNLAIGVDVTGDQTYAMSRLGNVEFDFPDALFRRPKGYRLKK